jgi:hypothetical protein
MHHYASLYASSSSEPYLPGVNGSDSESMCLIISEDSPPTSFHGDCSVRVGLRGSYVLTDECIKVSSPQDEEFRLHDRLASIDFEESVEVAPDHGEIHLDFRGGNGGNGRPGTHGVSI